MGETLNLNCDKRGFWQHIKIDDNENAMVIGEYDKLDLITYMYLQRFKYEKQIQDAIKNNYNNFVKEGKFAFKVWKFLYDDIDYSKADCNIIGKETNTRKGIDVLNHITIKTIVDKLADVFNNRDYMQFRWNNYNNIEIRPTTIISNHLKEMRIFDLKIVAHFENDLTNAGGWANEVFDNHKYSKATLEFNTGKIDFNYADEYKWTMRKEVFKINDNLGKYFDREIFWDNFKDLDHLSTDDCDDLELK